MQTNSIYLYPNRLDVYAIDSASWKNERFRMVYNRKIKIYRSVDNRIDFQARNGDQKAYNTSGTTLVFKLINKSDNSLQLQKDLSTDDATKGRHYVTLTRDDMIDIEPGFYDFSVVKETRDTIIGTTQYTVTTSNIMYLDSQFGGVGTLEVEGDVDGSSYETTLVDHFAKTIPYDETPTFFESSIINAQPNVTNPNSTHTFQFYFSNYIGDVVLQGSFDDGANPGNAVWTDLNTQNIISSQSITYKNITGRYNWFRIKHTPDENNTGTVDKILYR